MNEKRFRQLMEKVTNFAILFTDETGIIQEWNVGAEALFGVDKADAVGRSAEMIFTPDDRAADIPNRERATAAKNGVAEDERWHIRRDGSFFFASGLMHALYEDGKLTGFVKIVRDLTERMELEAAVDGHKDNLDVKIKERPRPDGEFARVLHMEMSRKKREDYLRLKLLQRALESQEDERKRISRDIHDHLGQELTALRLKIQSLKDEAHGHNGLDEPIQSIQEIARRIDDTVDFLAWELRPNFVTEIGLVRAVENYLKQWSAQFGIPAHCTAVKLADKRLNEFAELNLYRILQESLNNVAKHAKASRVDVLLENRGEEVVMIVEDNGRGFEVNEKANTAAGLGLIGMGERAALLLGTAEIESTVGQGTSVFVRVPANFQNAAMQASN
jgi:PAS domain S-box-containing protein